MADQFQEPFIETSPEALEQIGFAKIRETFPQWNPSAPGLLKASIGAHAAITAELRDIAAIMPRAAFRTLGAKLYNVPPIEAQEAVATFIITAIDNLGYQLDAGTQFTVQATGDRTEGFAIDEDAIIPVGSTTVSVTATALVAGAQGSGLTGEVKPVQTFKWIESVALEEQTTEGVDAEDDDTYLNRLSRVLETMIRRPVLAEDVPVFAQQVPGVFRTYVFDNYNADTLATDQEKCISVFPIDEGGADLPADTKSALLDLLLTTRESNMQWFVRDPTRTDIRVKYWIAIKPGYDEATVVAAVDAAVTDYFSSARWGGDQTQEVPVWDTTQTVVRRGKVVQVIENVLGVAYVSRTVGGISGALGVLLAPAASALVSDDIVLPGPAPLPNLTLLEHVVIS